MGLQDAKTKRFSGKRNQGLECVIRPMAVDTRAITVVRLVGSDKVTKLQSYWVGVEGWQFRCYRAYGSELWVHSFRMLSRI